MRIDRLLLLLTVFALTACTGADTITKKRWENRDTTVRIMDLSGGKGEFGDAGHRFGLAIEDALDDTAFVVTQKQSHYVLKFKVVEFQEGKRWKRMMTLGIDESSRAMMKAPITVEDVLNSRMIAYPFRLLQCCLVTDGGGALILTSADRAKDFPQKPVYILGTGESVETPMVSQMETFNSSRAFKVAGPTAFKEAGISHKDVDHLMIYDAFAHLPLYGLGDLGFMPYEETGKFIADGNTRPGGKLPLNTNGGGLSYMHSGMYGMYALQESVRQMRGIAPAQVEGAKISVCHGVGGMFAASGTIIFTNER